MEGGRRGSRRYVLPPDDEVTKIPRGDTATEETGEWGMEGVVVVSGGVGAVVAEAGGCHILTEALEGDWDDGSTRYISPEEYLHMTCGVWDGGSDGGRGWRDTM